MQEYENPLDLTDMSAPRIKHIWNLLMDYKTAIIKSVTNFSPQKPMLLTLTDLTASKNIPLYIDKHIKTLVINFNGYKIIIKRGKL